MINGVRVSSTYITEISKDRVISFSELSFISHSEMTENNQFILDLLCEIVNGNTIEYSYDSKYSSSADLEFLGMRSDGESEVSQANRWGVNCDSIEDARVRSIIADQFKDVVFRRVRGGGELRFFLDLEVGDDLPQRFLTLIEEIYTACDFDDSSYTAIYFYNENTDEPEDRLRVFFNRIQYWPTFWGEFEDQPDVGKMRLSALINGPTYEEYTDEINALFDTMDFFISKPRDMF